MNAQYVFTPGGFCLSVCLSAVFSCNSVFLLGVRKSGRQVYKNVVVCVNIPFRKFTDHCVMDTCMHAMGAGFEGW